MPEDFLQAGFLAGLQATTPEEKPNTVRQRDKKHQ
jgi:hypothetical protein